MDNEITRIITSSEALRKTKNSKTALTKLFKEITDDIIKAAEKGEYQAWVCVPDDLSFSEDIIIEIQVCGYTIGNRQGNKILIKWG